jgi:hypothetical protein
MDDYKNESIKFLEFRFFKESSSSRPLIEMISDRMSKTS